MTEAVIIFAALLILASAILAALYVIVRAAPPPTKQQAFRRHRLWDQYRISKSKYAVSMIAVTPVMESTKASLASW